MSSSSLPAVTAADATASTNAAMTFAGNL